LPCEEGWLLTPSMETCVSAINEYDLTKSWYEARDVCQKNNGDLVIIRDSNMTNFITSHATGRIFAQILFARKLGTKLFGAWIHFNNEASVKEGRSTVSAKWSMHSHHHSF
ncbi:hypothetical protein PoB_005368700, partial [Plakobranchus ocellatus]